MCHLNQAATGLMVKITVERNIKQALSPKLQGACTWFHVELVSRLFELCVRVMSVRVRDSSATSHRVYN